MSEKTAKKNMWILLLVLVALAVGYWLGSSSQFASDRAARLKSAQERKQRLAEKAETVWLDTGLTPEERKAWHRTPEGSEVLPLSFFQSLEDEQTGRPFIEIMGRYGFLPDLAHETVLPIGWGSHPFNMLGAQFEAVGINCSACHTSEIQYQGKRMRIDGAPNLIEVERFFRDVNHSFTVTIENPAKAFNFIRKMIHYHHDPKQSGELFEVSDSTLAFLDSVGDPATAENTTKAAYRVASLIGQSVNTVIHSGGKNLVSDGEQLVKSLSDLSTNEFEKYDSEVRSTMQMLTQAEALLKRKAAFLKRVSWAFDNQTRSGPGRADSFDVIRDALFPEQYHLPMNAPVSVPDLFSLAHYDWVHWDANTSSMLERNVAQAIALGADFDPVTYHSTVLIRNINKLNHVAQHLHAPKWPEDILGSLDQEKVQRGQELFASNCADCHDNQKMIAPDQVGTDPSRLKFFAVPMGDHSYAQALQDLSDKALQAAFTAEGVTTEEASKMESTNAVWRTTGKYRARLLHGVWATAPFLHNGSVPTLYDLLHRQAQRPSSFPLGQREFDPVKVGFITNVDNPVWTFNTSVVGNSNSGHEFGADLSEDQKWDLIEYLKTR